MQERRSIPAQSQREGAEGRFYQRYTHSPNPSSPLFYFGSGLSCELSLLAAPDIVVAADCPRTNIPDKTQILSDPSLATASEIKWVSL